MKALLFRLIAVAGGILLALLVAEVAVRLSFPPMESARLAPDVGASRRRSGENAKHVELTRKGDLWDQVLYLRTPGGVRLRANAHAIIENHYLGGKTVDIRTNSLGYRNRELGKKARKRVLFLGDSITMQDYLPEEDTIVRQVETLSEKTDEPLETVNSGVSAIGTANELAILQETGLATAPDVIVLDWYLNDLEPSPGIERVRPYGILAWSRLAQILLTRLARWQAERENISTIPPETIERWREEVRKKFPPPKQGDARTDPAAIHHWLQTYFLFEGTVWADSAWERITPLIAEIKRRADIAGVPFLIVMFPDWNQVHSEQLFDDPQRNMKKVAADLGIPVLDLLPTLREAARKDPSPLFLDWCHPSERGSREIAPVILDFIQRET